MLSRTVRRIQHTLRSWSTANRSERGQVLVVVTISMIALVAFVGLTVDVGLLFLNHGKLRRAVDAAALAASSQFREGYNISDLSLAATEFLRLNGVEDPSAAVETCATSPGDPDLCKTPPRKLVRVTAAAKMQTAFLRVVGIREVTLTARSVSEAASIDAVLVIDTSESMARDGIGDERDPSYCNHIPNGSYTGDCKPFHEVKRAAVGFVEQLFFPYDRVAVVTFDQTARTVLHLTGDESTIVSAIKGLGVVEPDPCVYPDGTAFTGDGPCRAYEWYPPNTPPYGPYNIFACPIFNATGDPSTCGTTNIGGGLREAGNEFAVPPIRQESLWVVLLLSDGAANSSHPDPFCPNFTWQNPYCRDYHLPYQRYCAEATDISCITKGGVFDISKYSTDDYARDMADFVAEDQRALIFTIGLGYEVQTSIPIEGGEGAGERLLKYVADVGDGTVDGIGSYYFSPTTGQLEQIFLDIASNIATRIAK
jgi:Flp pilus assembly protein TadG